jgi:hypothetical protein
VNPTRKVGLILAAVATALWAVIVAASFMTGPDDGVNIGAALLALLALPLSVGASVTLLVSLRTTAQQGVSEQHPLARRIAAGLALVSIVCLQVSLALGGRDSVDGVALAVVLLVAGIATFVLSSALFALPRSHHR